MWLRDSECSEQNGEPQPWFLESVFLLEVRELLFSRPRARPRTRLFLVSYPHVFYEQHQKELCEKRRGLVRIKSYFSGQGNGRTEELFITLYHCARIEIVSSVMRQFYIWFSRDPHSRILPDRRVCVQVNS